MKNVQKIDLGLTGYDELFMNDAERKENKLPRIYDVPISEIDDFPDHPFKVKIDEDMDQLVQSIKERGIITPVTLRPKEDGRYEIVSGHRRKKACELAGLDTVKAEVREMTRDEAIILMVESNLQRSTILPSEKAFSYKMRLEAMNRQGQRNDLTSGPVVPKFSRDALGDKAEESGRQVSRYIETGVCPKYAGCVNGVAWFKEHNQWVDGSETPSPGMVIFYDWDSPNGSSGPQDGLSDHTGIVERVENGIVYTVEGNSGDSCRQCHRAVGNYEILGYGVLIP